MHETGIVQSLIHQLQAAAIDAGATRVSGVDVTLGALSQFSPEHFRQHFAEAAQGTLADGATLRIRLSEDAGDPHAQSVMIESINLEVPEEADGAP